MSAKALAEAEEFLKICDQFKLGELDTESTNPVTAKLSQLCSKPETVPEGLKCLQQVDINAINVIMATIPQMEELAKAVHETLIAGKKVVCEGCGATGRLSLSVEVFALEGMVEEQYKGQVKGFMAGGDAALIRSIEQFEDRNDFGARQLREIGFEEGDLLLAITEGGETPFVIAACEEALTISKKSPYFIYCNPDGPLCRIAERSKRVIENDRIIKINLSTGPMAITGSTRMQATTVQLACAGLAIKHHADPSKIRGDMEALLNTITTIQYSQLAPFTSSEAQMYKDGEHFLYETDYFSVTVMTDTTERAPTFSIPPYENFDRPAELPSPVYLHLPGVTGAAEGWNRLLRRDPRSLEWEGGVAERAGMKQILGYDFSDNVVAKRKARIGEDKTKLKAVVSYEPEQGGILFAIPHVNVSVLVKIPDATVLKDKLLVNIVAKCLLNAHSTAVMGVYGRYEGNVMTYVRASNNKLIDRSARYIKLLLERRQEGVEKPVAPTYEEIVKAIFTVGETLPTSEPVVLHVLNHFLGTNKL